MIIDLSVGGQECGVIPGSEDDYRDLTKYNPFVFNGDEVQEGMFPWMAYVNLKGQNKSFQPFCGGVLISRRSVATAGHCVGNG